VLTGILPTSVAYTAFANPTIVLIIVAFLVARAVVKTGLGQRLGHRAISLFGRSTLGLSYAIYASSADRSGFPEQHGALRRDLPAGALDGRSGRREPEREDRKRLAFYLMFSGMTSLTLSSALWLTAMAGNPLGAEIARNVGAPDQLRLVAHCGLGAHAPLHDPAAVGLLQVIRPEVTAMPEAPAEAKKALRALGGLTRDQKIVGWTFAGWWRSGAPRRR
jgi:DASS family divalent anion:Na+ symporter